MEKDQLTELIKEDKVSSRLWVKYLPYWPLFLVLLFFNLCGAWFYLRYTPLVYESNASIIIKDSKRGIEDAKIIGELNQLTASTIVENEMEVLKSRVLMEEVVNNLALYAPVFEEGKIRTSSAYLSYPVKVEAQDADFIKEDVKIYFTYDPALNRVTVNATSYPLNQWVKTEQGVFRFTLRPHKFTSHLPVYFSLIHPQTIAADLLSRLDISSNKISSVVYLKIVDENPSRAVDILNALIRAYEQATIKENNLLADSTLSFVEERLNVVAKDLEAIEFKLQQYKTRMGTTDIGTQGKLFLENVSDNDQRLSEVNMRLAILTKVEQFVSSQDSRGALVPSTLGVEDPQLTGLLSKLSELELQYEKLKRTTGENNPVLSSLNDQIQKIKPGIIENIRSQQQNLQASKRNLYSTNSEYSSLLRALPQQERDLVQISREQSIKSSIYNYLLQKREETALSFSTVPDSRIIDKAASSWKPVGPKKAPVYILAFAMAVGLTIVIVSARHSLNRTIMFRQEIEKMTSFPIIGEISLNSKVAGPVIDKNKSPFVTEQFRKLRTSLSYIGIGSQKKKILITSTVSGEGKSFVAVNLGLSLARAGKRVVIVEFDVSNPTLAMKMNCRNGKGIADYLVGNVQTDEIINKTGANNNLFLIHAGTLPDEPSDLILSPRVEELFQYLDNVFDYILVDTAPVGVLSDGYVLSKHCDATLYVVRHKYTPKLMLERLEEDNKINELKNLALVFNGVSLRGFGKAYGYGYGYGYVDKSLGKNRQLINS